MCGTKYGVPMIMGLKQSSGKIAWALSGTIGYNTNFTGIQCTPSLTGSGAVLVATFSGDTDGSDNWEYVKSIDTEATITNYPAFNYAATYGTTNSLTGEYQDGWYLPSIAELAEVYKNKEKLNKVLIALGTDKADVIKAADYWSSSQDATHFKLVWLVGFYDGNIDTKHTYGKSSSDYVLVVRICD